MFFEALLKMTNLERGGEATHGDMGGCTACQVEVGAAYFSWEMMIMMMMILMTIITIIVIHHQNHSQISTYCAHSSRCSWCSLQIHDLNVITLKDFPYSSLQCVVL